MGRFHLKTGVYHSDQPEPGLVDFRYTIVGHNGLQQWERTETIWVRPDQYGAEHAFLLLLDAWNKINNWAYYPTEPEYAA